MCEKGFNLLASSELLFRTHIIPNGRKSGSMQVHDAGIVYSRVEMNIYIIQLGYVKHKISANII
jgi:hypothetical protein